MASSPITEEIFRAGVREFSDRSDQQHRDTLDKIEKLTEAIHALALEAAPKGTNTSVYGSIGAVVAIIGIVATVLAGSIDDIESLVDRETSARELANERIAEASRERHNSQTRDIDRMMRALEIARDWGGPPGGTRHRPGER